MDNPIEKGKIKYFCRTKGHGFVQPDRGGDDVFVHISDIDGEYVPREGDEVTFRICPIPPKLEKFQAIGCRIINFTPDVHLRWDSPVEESEKQHDFATAEKAPDNLVT
jgi:cold shock CspA family protein